MTEPIRVDALASDDRLLDMLATRTYDGADPLGSMLLSFAHACDNPSPAVHARSKRRSSGRVASPAITLRPPWSTVMLRPRGLAPRRLPPPRRCPPPPRLSSLRHAATAPSRSCPRAPIRMPSARAPLPSSRRANRRPTRPVSRPLRALPPLLPRRPRGSPAPRRVATANRSTRRGPRRMPRRTPNPPTGATSRPLCLQSSTSPRRRWAEPH